MKPNQQTTQATENAGTKQQVDLTQNNTNGQHQAGSKQNIQISQTTKERAEALKAYIESDLSYNESRILICYSSREVLSKEAGRPRKKRRLGNAK